MSHVKLTGIKFEINKAYVLSSCEKTCSLSNEFWKSRFPKVDFCLKNSGPWNQNLFSWTFPNILPLDNKLAGFSLVLQ